MISSAPACSPSSDGDGDSDGDTDVDTDTDVDGDSDGDSGCDPAADCCSNADCSNGVYCDGIEVCDRGRCDPGIPIDCDDGLDCTNDVCDEMANLCAHGPVHEECSDDDVCNGEERCAPAEADHDERGCIPGRPVVCDDGDPCTDDYCEEDVCMVRLRDSDGDGHGDEDCSICDPEDPSDCERGDDCNDADPDSYPGATEICDDGTDNNCDRVRDYADTACTVPNDTCATAIPLTRGVPVHGSLRRTTGDIDSSCSPAGDLDVAFSFSIPSAQDVEITVDAAGGRDLTVTLSADCGSPEGDLRCTTGRRFTQISRALAAGTYFVIVSAGAEADFAITLDYAAPAPRPDGDQCSTAPDVSAGGSFSGTTTGYDPDYETSCGEATDRDATFVLNVAETASMDLSVSSTQPVTVAVQPACGVVAGELACFEGDPAAGWVRHLSPGTYYVIVKSPAETDFDLDIAFMPTAADACDDALDISTAGTYRGSTLGMTADIDTACGSPVGPDSAYMFTIATEQDVTVDFRSGGEDTTLSLQSTCGDAGSELRCSTGTDFQLRGRSLPAGTYYLVTTGDAGADYDFDLSFAAPVPRPPEDLCTGAIDATGGGTFSGDTMDAENDYDSRCGDPLDVDIAYYFDLATAQAVDLAITAGTGPVAVAIQPDCGVIGTERACFETATTASRHFRSLDPGRYYLVFKTPVADTFGFDLSFGPPEPTLLEPYVDPAGATTVALSSGSSDDGQYNIDIAPLAFPFNGTDYQCLAVSTNGYIRFGAGPCSSYPSATSYSDTATDIDEVYAASIQQITWLGDDGYAGSSVSYRIDTAGNRVVITYLDHHRLGYTGTNDVQIILHCDTGDIQISYVDCTFDTGTTSTYHWSIGVSEPALAGGTLQLHDFAGQTPGSVVPFGPGAINQSPEHAGPTPYLPLNGRAIYFARDGSGWSVLLDDIPL